MRVAFKLAARFLTSSRGQTILILLGITIGVSVQIFIGSLIDGLQRSLIDKTIGSSSQITITPGDKEKIFELPAGLLDTLSNQPGIEVVSINYSASGFIQEQDEPYPVLVRGFDLPAANEIYRFSDRLVAGRMPSGEKEAIIGQDLADETNIQIGKTIIVANPQGQMTEIVICGIFDLKVAAINQSWLVTSLSASQQIFNQENQLNAIEMQVKEVFSADSIAESLRPLLPSDLDIVNWKEQNEELLSGLAGQSASSYMIQIFVMLAVLLGISSVLAISVVQKSRQIGILKAMGIKDRTASLIFLLQGLLLGIAGSLSGTLLGIGFAYAFSQLVKNPDGTSLVPFYLDYRFIAASILIAVFAAIAAALIPARKSSRLNPIEVIRNG